LKGKENIILKSNGPQKKNKPEISGVQPL